MASVAALKLSKQLKFTLSLSIFIVFILCQGYSQTSSSIGNIQGNGRTSPLLNDFIRLKDVVVTATHRDMLFVQPKVDDGDPTTSAGIMVIWSAAENFSVNDELVIEGIVREKDNNTVIDAQSISLIAQQQLAIPAVQINNEFPGSQIRNVHALESVEGQLVSFTNLAIVAPSEGGDLAYVSGSDQRPLREPGIKFPGILNLPVWDGNPEVFYIVPNGLGLAANESLHANMKITGTGIIVEEEFNYAIYPIAYIVVEEEQPSIPTIPNEEEFNVASFNTLFLSEESSDYQLRLNKISNYIISQLALPDVIALQEVTGQQEFEDLAERLSSLSGEEYTPLTENANLFLNNGYLIRNTFTVQKLEALGKNLSFEGGSLHDRPPLLLEGKVNTALGTQNLSILNLHQRSLSGITGNNSGFVKRKRSLQSISVSEMVKRLQDENKNIIVVGDFNAFQFSDGYVDVVNQIAGTPTLDAEFPVQPQGIIPLLNISATVPAEQDRYSFVFRGNAQMLDHCLVSEFTDFEVSNFQFGRGNCDYPDAMLDQDVPFRASDHDGFSLFLNMNSPVIAGNPSVASAEAVQIPNPFNSNNEISIRIAEKQNVKATMFNMAGQLIYQYSLGAIMEDKVSLPFIENLASGIYILKLTGRSLDVTRKLVIVK